jgi:purine-binding chemotaxis protein CheW
MDIVQPAQGTGTIGKRKRRARGSVVRKIQARGKSGNTVQVVEFVLGDEPFAFDLFDIREVISMTEISQLPDSPPYIKGIIDLRGVITTIIDLKVLMHLTTDDKIAKNPRIIILDHVIMGKMIGLLVDDVLSVSTYSSDEIDRSAQDSDDKNRNIVGVIRQNHGEEKGKRNLVILLNIKTIIENVEKEI